MLPPRALLRSIEGTLMHSIRSGRASLRLAAAASLLLLTLACVAEAEQDPSKEAPAAAPTALTEEEKTFYFLGTLTGRSLERFSLTEEEMAVVQRGIDDYRAGETITLDGQTYGGRLQQIATERAAQIASAEKAASQAFLDEQAARPGVEKLEGGLLIERISPGDGDQPTPANTVKVHYHGTLRDGKVFDSSVDRGQPFETPLTRVVPCWQRGVSAMKVGEKARLYCPSDLAYGDRGSPPTIPGGAALVFEVELIEVVR